jgi:molybdopterin converting factor small subunit
MAIWDFSDFDTDQLYKALEHCEQLEVVGIAQQEDMLDELRAELTRREEEGKEYTHIISFVAVNNDSYDEVDRTIYLHSAPKDRKETKELVKGTYDGVWEPQMDTIKVYSLTPIV